MFAWLQSFLRRKKTSRNEKILSALFAFAYVALMGYAGNVPVHSVFYDALKKPAALPPDWVFAVVWPLLFISLAAAAYFVWNFYETEVRRRLFALLYLLNGFFIYLWPQFFFVKNAIDTALFILVAMVILAELMTIVAFYINRRAAYCMIPYLAWILFATYLNTAILVLNS